MGAIADRKDTTNYLIFQNLSTGFFTIRRDGFSASGLWILEHYAHQDYVLKELRIK